MPQFADVKDDVIVTDSIELERMLTVLTNVYSDAKFRDHARFLPYVEARLKASLKELMQTDFDNMIARRYLNKDV